MAHLEATFHSGKRGEALQQTLEHADRRNRLERDDGARTMKAATRRSSGGSRIPDLTQIRAQSATSSRPKAPKITPASSRLARAPEETKCPYTAVELILFEMHSTWKETKCPYTSGDSKLELSDWYGYRVFIRYISYH